MALNHNLLINLTVLSFLIYASFLITVQLTDTSSSTIVRFKYAGRVTDYVDVIDDSANTVPYDSGLTRNSSHARPRKDRFFINAQSSPVCIPTLNRTPITPSKTAIEPGKTDQEATKMKEGDRPRPQITERDQRGYEGKPPKFISDETVTTSGCVIRILFWCDDTVLFNGSFFCKRAGGCRLEVKRSVRVSDLGGAEIVVFYHRRVEKPWDELIRSRPLGQSWVFFSRECRRNCPGCLPPESYGSVFNISMTHLTDSDIFVPYGRYIPHEKAMVNDRSETNINWAVNKSRHVLWVASNCKKAAWDRKGFAEHLSEYTDVDTYGRCGSLTCPREEEEYCREIFMQYKFYLALENSFCRDYITEKVWTNSFGNNLIPVVVGASRVDYEKALPPNSFIFAEDFNSTGELARFIDEVGRNTTRYGEFFRWRELGRTTRWTRVRTFQLNTFCRIFSKLNSIKSGSENAKSKRKISIEEWWRTSCRSVESLKFADIVRL